MQSYLEKPKKQQFKFLPLLTGLLFLGMSSLSYAANIVITGNTMINAPTTYDGDTLDLTNGEFTVTKDATLTINNSVVNVTISPTNPFFTALTNGQLRMINSTVNVTVNGIAPTPNAQATNYLINLNDGEVHLDSNTFKISDFYTVGFFISNPNIATQQSVITNNTIANFHGGIYLLNSNNAEINDNTFERVSFTNIFNNGTTNQIHNNIFSFPGNLMLGDAIDIVSTDSASVVGNVISSSSNYGIYILGSKNLFINNNKITDGLSHGIYIAGVTPKEAAKNPMLTRLLAQRKVQFNPNSNITISDNYIALNRYGLAGITVQNLTVENNTFIQRFADSASRSFWTNNDNLLIGVTGLVWLNNLYKEGFTQVNGGDNSLSLNFVKFPAHGGVSL